jgi:hypothetical protein
LIEVKGCVLNKHLDAKVNGHDSHQLMEWVDRHGAESTGNMSNGFILGGAEFSEETSLTCEPNWGSICKD